MASSKFFACFLVALCFFQCTQALRLARDAPKEETNTFEELSKQATTFLGELNTQFNQVITAKDGDELRSVLKTNTDNFIAKVSDLSKNLQAQMGTVSNDVSGVVSKFVAKLNETVADLKEQHPEAVQKAKEFQDKLEHGFKTIVEESDKVAKSLNENTKDMQDEVAKLTKMAYDQVLQTAKTIQKQVHEVANKE